MEAVEDGKIFFGIKIKGEREEEAGSGPLFSPSAGSLRPGCNHHQLQAS